MSSNEWIRRVQLSPSTVALIIEPNFVDLDLSICRSIWIQHAIQLDLLGDIPI